MMGYKRERACSFFEETCPIARPYALSTWRLVEWVAYVTKFSNLYFLYFLYMGVNLYPTFLLPFFLIVQLLPVPTTLFHFTNYSPNSGIPCIVIVLCLRSSSFDQRGYASSYERSFCCSCILCVLCCQPGNLADSGAMNDGV